MSFSKIAAIVMLVCSATTGFIIPEGTPDGLYSASIDVDGTEIHTPVANTSNLNEHHIDSRHPHATIDDFASRILPRDSFDVYCGGTRNMNPGDTDYANRELDRQCGTGTIVRPRMNFYSIHGDVVAFFCNLSKGYPWDHGAGPKSCYASSRQADSRSITNKCGRYNSGWTTVRKAGGVISWSYGYDSRHSEFCRTGA